MINLGDFSISGSTIHTMVIMFLIYSTIVVGLGMYVQHQSRRGGNRLSGYLTGGGGLNGFEAGMIAATSAMAGGTMVGSPGVSYTSGYVYVIGVYSAFLSTFVTIGSFGRKFSIVRQRTGAQTITQLLRHRFQSRAVVLVIVGIGGLFTAVTGGGQIASAAKVFSTVTGGRYYLGLALVIGITALYTVSGGVKSLAKIAVIQGIIMLIAVMAIALAQYHNILTQHGTLEAGMRMLAQTNPAAIQVRTWQPLYALGMAMTTGWGVTGFPAVMQSCMYFDNHRSMKHSILVGCSCFILIQGIMAGSGPLTAILNPTLSQPDLSTMYIATHFLPSWLAGVIFCGIFAAIQSSIGAYMVSISGMLAVDLFHGVLRPQASEKTVTHVNWATGLCAALVMTLCAINPGELVQYLILFASSAVAVAFVFPIFLSAYWGGTTGIGVVSGSLSSIVVYILAYFLSDQACWATIGNPHPLLPAAAASLLVTILVSLCTQHKKVPLGVYRVWFCQDYDEFFAHTFDALNSANRKK